MTNAGRASCHTAEALDEHEERRELERVGERALTVYVDKYEIVTSMTIGTRPELLTLGYLHNRGFIENIADIGSAQVDWEIEAVAVTTRLTEHSFLERLGSRTVTTGCGQGTVFGRLMDQLREIRVPKLTVRQPEIYDVFNALRDHNEVLQTGRSGSRLRAVQRRQDPNLRRGRRTSQRRGCDRRLHVAHRHGRRRQDFLHYRTADLGNGDQGHADGDSGAFVAFRHYPHGIRTGASGRRHHARPRDAKGKHFLALSSGENIVFDVPLPKRAAEGRFSSEGTEE